MHSCLLTQGDHAGFLHPEDQGQRSDACHSWGVQILMDISAWPSFTSIHRHLKIIGLSQRQQVWQERIYPFHFCVRKILPGVEESSCLWAAKSQLAWFWRGGCDSMDHRTPFNLRALVCLVLGNILPWTWGHNQNIHVVLPAEGMSPLEITGMLLQIKGKRFIILVHPVEKPAIFLWSDNYFFLGIQLDR